MRALLVVVAVQIVAFSLPALILGDEHETGYPRRPPPRRVHRRLRRRPARRRRPPGTGPRDAAGRRRCSPAPWSSPRSSTWSNGRRPARRRGPAPAGAAQRRAGLAARRAGAAPHARRLERPVAADAARRCATTSPTSPDAVIAIVTSRRRLSGHEVAHPDPDHHLVGAGERDVGDDVELAVGRAGARSGAAGRPRASARSARWSGASTGTAAGRDGSQQGEVRSRSARPGPGRTCSARCRRRPTAGSSTASGGDGRHRRRRRRRGRTGERLTSTDVTADDGQQPHQLDADTMRPSRRRCSVAAAAHRRWHSRRHEAAAVVPHRAR